jgi:Zn-dependent peptidase ImmA (M78 family)
MKKARTAQTLRPIAEQLLKQCKVKAPPVQVEEIARMLGAQIRYSPFEGELAGMLVRGDEDQIVIGVNSLHHPNRQRFTIAHECAHLRLHEGIRVHIDRTFRVNRRDEVSSKAIDPDEIEANRFAAELLMPYDMIMNDLVEHEIDMENEEELKELANRYEVSVQALTHRVTNLLKNIF